MTSSMTGRNGLPDALGNRSEPQVAVATTPAPISTATATLAATAHASDADSRDSKGATSAPPSTSLSANAPSSTAAGPVAESSSSSATSAAPPPPPPTAAAPSAPTSTPAPAPAVPSTTSPTAPSTASIPRPSTPNRETSTSASATAPASQPPPSTPPSRSALNTLATSALNADAALGTRPQEAASSAQASAPVDASSNDHPMPDAPAVDASAPSNSAVELQQTTPMQMDLPANNMTEPFAPSTPYNQVTLPTLNQHAYMMMALASMAAPPTTITPSQVTLPNPMDEAFNGLAPANSIRQANADKTLESFARIEFADSVFQMTTYAVIIGRDQRALEQARRDEKRDEAYRRRVEQHAENGLPPPSPPRGPDRSKFSKSYVSEEGGMLGPESDNGESGRPAKRRKTSTQGSSQHDNDEAAAQAQENMISNRQYVSHTPGAAAVDLTSLRPSPWHVPFIGIHSPGPNIASKTKAISREHLKIAYNEKEGVFEAIPLHKNGFFCEDVHYKSEKVVLKCGDRLQIKDIDFRFLINGVERGRTGAEEDVEEETAVQKRHAHGGKEMSFDFESSHVNGQVQDTSDELSEVASPPELSDFGEEEEEAEAEAEEAEEAEPMETVEAEPEPEPKQEPELERPAPVQEPFVKPESVPEPELQPHGLMPQIPKKRGPGRPPKNGIMSKREQRLLKKQQQEMAKKTLPQAPPIEPPIKRKVGRPRKHPLPDDASERPEKRKYKPRKPKEDGAEGSDAERRAREKKEKKARPKSPPLNLNVNDYTKEELQKPNKNYGVLIDETLTAAGPDGLTLKQIYKRICERYPYFFFRTETKGWESSVRHNLIGNEAFRKDETTNLWSRVPGVELDAGKKRKASSPDRNNLAASQAYNQQYAYQYNAAQHVAPGAPGYPPGQAPPAYQMPAYNAQQAQAQAPQAPRPVQPYAASASPPAPGQPTPSQPAAGQPAQTAPTQPPAPAQLPAGYGPPPAPARPQLGGPQPGAYSSPYAPRPPPPANPPVKSEDGHPAPAAPTAATASAQPPPPLAAAKTVPGPAPASQPVAAATAAAQTSRPPAAAPATATPARPVIDPRLLAAVVNLKNGLVLNLNRARNPRSEGIVMSALNRCLGLKKQATENDKMESICMKGIRQVMEGFTKNSPTPGPAASASPPASDLPPVLEPRVLASLTGFKDVSVKALRAKLGEAKAEAVTLSAIDRVLGFADASIVPPPGEGETVGNFEGVEQHLMKSIRQLLEGMNQTVQGS